MVLYGHQQIKGTKMKISIRESSLVRSQAENERNHQGVQFDSSVLHFTDGSKFSREDRHAQIRVITPDSSDYETFGIEFIGSDNKVQTVYLDKHKAGLVAALLTPSSDSK